MPRACEIVGSWLSVSKVPPLFTITPSKTREARQPTMAQLYPEALPPSSGIPIAQGVVVGERQAEVDALPLLDMGTAQALGRVSAFTIVQRPSLTESLCAVCERSNIYDVFDGFTGQHIFFAKERSTCCYRFSCAPRHSFFIEFKLYIFE